MASLAPIANLKVTTVAGDDQPALTDGVGGDLDLAEFNSPSGLVVAADGSLYVADTGNNCIRKVVFAGDGTPTVSTYAGDKTSGSSGDLNDVNPLNARFNQPVGLALASNGDLYVADTGNHRIRKIAAGGGAVTAVAGTTLGKHDDAGAKAQFNSPAGLALDGTDLYVADSGNNLIRKVDLSDPALPVTTVAGNVTDGQGMHNDADANKAQFFMPYSLGIDNTRKLYVLDALNHRIRVVDLASPTRAVTTFAGPADSVTSQVNGWADGAPTAAKFDFSAKGGIAVTPDGTVYIADSANERIRRISTAGGVETVAGDGTVTSANLHTGAFQDGSGLQARFSVPVGVAIASNGTLYVADQSNNRIRKVK